ncbi:uncharacterized protein B0T15DRAFT_563203, partial [Chaetomium strumarium]
PAVNVETRQRERGISPAKPFFRLPPKKPAKARKKSASNPQYAPAIFVLATRHRILALLTSETSYPFSMASLSGYPSTSTAAPMRSRRQRTCIPCAKAKRRCDKTIPCCIRCVDRGVSCIYKPRRGVYATMDNPGAAGEATIISTQGGKSTETAVPQDSSSAAADATVAADYRWFLSPPSWVPQHGLCAEEPALGEETLPHFINKLKSWAETWVREGHSPLMHRELYRSWMPAGARQAALRIMEERCSRLIQSQPVPLQQVCSNSDNLSPCILVDTLAHLARTQALFVYQLIRLFDGDIRARAQAECHMDILDAWAIQMLDSARLDCILQHTTQDDSPELTQLPMTVFNDITSTGSIPGQPRTTTANNPLNPDPNLAQSQNPFALPHGSEMQPPLLWRTWVTAESIRRIYLAATFMQSVYRTLKQGWSACPGGAAFTALSGLWDAKSGFEWMGILRDTRMCHTMEGTSSTTGTSKEGDVARGLSPWVMVQSLEAWKILRQGRWEEVDEFARGVLEISYGVERVEGWRFERG